MTRVGSASRAGFTLIELLVVMVIIAILAALITTAVFAGLRLVREKEIFTEVSKLASAMENFKAQFQRYPPDGSKGGGSRSKGGDPVKEFTFAVFPDRGERASQWPTDLTPGTSIYFWLARIAKDPQDPYRQTSTSTSGQQVEDRYKFYDFKEAQLSTGTSTRMYFPPNANPLNDPPYVYFNKDTYANASYEWKGKRIKPYHFGRSRSGGGGGAANQYEWAASESFQIIAGGLDNILGTGGQLGLDTATAVGGGGGEPISLDDEDNIVNFSDKKVKDIKRN